MGKKYGAQGIPHLVVVNGTEDRQVITKDGTEGVYEDPLGKSFPWKPKSFAEIWAGKQILTKDGSVSSSTFDDRYLMLYFSAHWCPPCRGFTPTLGKAYTELKAQRQDFELVFVSSDRDDAAFKEYFDDTPFWALAFEERETKGELSKHFGVQGIPSLVMLGEKWKTKVMRTKKIQKWMIVVTMTETVTLVKTRPARTTVTTILIMTMAAKVTRKIIKSSCFEFKTYYFFHQ